MKSIIASVLVAILSGQAARADEVMGYGSIRCRTLNGYYQKAGGTMGSIAEQWVTGYFSGLNMASSGRERDITEDAIARLLEELKAFCATHPDETPAMPISKAWMAMPRVKG